MAFVEGQRVWLKQVWFHPTHGRLGLGTPGVVAELSSSGSVDVVFDRTDALPVLTSPMVLSAARACPRGHGEMDVIAYLRLSDELEAAGMGDNDPRDPLVLRHLCVRCQYSIDEP